MVSYSKLFRGLLIMGLSLTQLVFVQQAMAGSKEEVIVATDAVTKPFTYKQGSQHTGYDIEVLKQIFKGSKTYRLTIKTVSFPSILSGIDSGRYHIAANDFGYSKERAETYLFSKPISKSHYALASKPSRTYRRLADLSGKKTQGMAGANYMQVLEKWNQSHPDKKPIHLSYVSGSSPFTQRLQQVEEGQLDFVFYDAISLTTAIKEQGFSLKVNQLTENLASDKDGLEYYLFAKDKKGKALQTFVNKGLAKLQKSGKLKTYSQDFFGGDFVSDLP
ncbi:amino acid ABC transporter substrate-binding protein [Streptococcus canis]|uniref:transporter substrate-binding domain-containing protein n=1 Tax=Streptococcus canis TaxID=1329 RepID=UPI0012F18484|nr:transporter substrate-binding domain-containing protein [Streptococcus canis]GFE47412.1 amino acid ABC transporter substrate-binding protein [Streptococcus canis]GFG43024.1 amino acid ABC transporter substrate-binding protein [Streptococcus canis]GFG46402.1 amino acid ABC transporter substrate-binding protein [Streptococcus canis]